MANNFRILSTTSPVYVSKDGVDTNAGTADLPKSTFRDWGGFYGTTVVGTGVYKGAISLASGSRRSFVADSIVVLNCTDDVNAVLGDNSYYMKLNEPPFNSENRFIFKLNGFDYIGSRRQLIYNTTFENGVFRHTGGSTQGCILRNCVFDCDFNLISSSSNWSIGSCCFFNSTINLPSSISYNLCFFDATTTIRRTTFSGSFANCNIRGLFDIGGVSYELKKDRNGIDIPSKVSNGIADVIDVYPNIYINNNFSQDPEFLNIEKRDYRSVSVTSPMLFVSGAASAGNTRASSFNKATDNVFANGVITGLTTSLGDFILDGGTTGTATSTSIQIAPIPQVVSYMNFAELLNFNSDIVKGLPENNNVTIVDNFADGTAGANPRRLTYEMRWSNQDAIPTEDTHWDNQFYTTAGSYSKFEQFTKPLIGTNLVGNGDPTFNVTGAVGIKAKWIQLRITMRNGIGFAI